MLTEKPLNNKNSICIHQITRTICNRKKSIMEQKKKKKMRETQLQAEASTHSCRRQRCPVTGAERGQLHLARWPLMHSWCWERGGDQPVQDAFKKPLWKPCAPPLRRHCCRSVSACGCSPIKCFNNNNNKNEHAQKRQQKRRW